MHIKEMLSTYFEMDTREHHFNVNVDVQVTAKASGKVFMLHTTNVGVLKIFSENKVNMILRELMLIKYVLKVMQARYSLCRHRSLKINKYHMSKNTEQYEDSITLEQLKEWESRTDQLIEQWIQGWGFNFLSVYCKVFDNMTTAHTVIHRAHKIMY